MILELGRQIEAMVREDGHFAEEHLDQSDLELKRVIEPDNGLQQLPLPVNGEKIGVLTEQAQDNAENAVLGWARRALAVRRVLRSRLQDKMRTAQDQMYVDWKKMKWKCFHILCNRTPCVTLDCMPLYYLYTQRKTIVIWFDYWISICNQKKMPFSQTVYN